MNQQDVRLQSRLDTVIGKREEVMAILAQAGRDRLTARPKPNAWSALEIAEHLVVSGRVLLDTRRKVDRYRRGPLACLRAAVVWIVFRLRIRVPVPDKAMEPNGTMSLQQVDEAWKANDRLLSDLLEQEIAERAAGGSKRIVFRHPVAGDVGLPHLLNMAAKHIDHHRPQIIKRLLE